MVLWLLAIRLNAPTVSSAEPGPELQKQGFTQGYELYRHFITMRYYGLTLYAVTTAALATLFFVQLPNMAKPDDAADWIKICGVVVAVAGFVFELCLAWAMIYYRELATAFAIALKLDGFQIPGTHIADGVLFIASFAIYSISAIAWAGFAEVPKKSELVIPADGQGAIIEQK
jgi:hypothetical protein